MANANTKNAEQTQSNSAHTPTAPTTESASKAAHAALDQVAQKAATAEDYVRKHASESAETLHEKREALEASLKSSVSRSRRFAQENPLLCAGLAFAAGMAVTALIRRK